MLFEDRRDAGKKLAKELSKYKGDAEVVVVGLARGGVVVAAEVAKSLSLPLDLVVIRKIRAPNNEELALGAIAEEGKGVMNDHLVSLLGVSKDYLRKEVEKERDILKKRKEVYLKGRTAPALEGKTVILVDDGIATGASMKVAIASMRGQRAGKVILAVPVAAPESIEEMKVDEAVCLSVPVLFQAVGKFYKDFSPVMDEEIINLLESV